MSQNLEEILTRGVEAIYPSKEAFSKALTSDKKLTIYHGIDPTAPSLHLGHLVALRKLRAFQNLGHKIILLIGDFTALIGDPTGKLQARKALTREEILKNAKDYKNQAAKLLNFAGENPAKIEFNSSWHSKMNFEDVIKLMFNFTVQQVFERDMFQKRIRSGKPILLPELIYPALQGYDSVAMKVDAEIGGSDQTFNMLVGRELVKKYFKKEKLVITTKLLTVGDVKMGKTESLFIPLSLPANEMFGKIMARPDSALMSFFELLTDSDLMQVEKMHPMKAKKQLAQEILIQLFGKEEALSAKAEFERVFQKRESPTQVQEFRPKAKTYELLDLIKEAKLISSSAEGKRLITSGATTVDNLKFTNPKAEIELKNGTVIKVGKYRFIKIKTD